ncbi:MAG: response regulator [Proteobacteria bacterium]|nr:response regulator [Pseudomonadota bacterium]
MAEAPLKYYIVDDDADAVELITLMLESAGHAVESQIGWIWNVPEIVRACPDCVLIDLMMGEQGGLELCRELRAHPELNQATLVIITAKKGDVWRQRSEEAGTDGFFIKPLDPSSFAAELEKLVRLPH